MLRSNLIPIGDGDTEEWSRFLEKAAKGSIKALEMLRDAMWAFVSDVTGDPSSRETLEIEDFFANSHKWFPVDCPVRSIQEFRDVAVECNWSPEFRVSETPRKRSDRYRGLWNRWWPVWEYTLLNDAMLLCLDKWSADHLFECFDQYDLKYDSLLVTSGMLYLSLIWPE